MGLNHVLSKQLLSLCFLFGCEVFCFVLFLMKSANCQREGSGALCQAVVSFCLSSSLK